MNKTKEKKEYKIWQLIIVGILILPFIVVLLAFIVSIAPFLMVAYIFKSYHELRLSKKEKYLTYKFKLQTNENICKLEHYKLKNNIK